MSIEALNWALKQDDIEHSGRKFVLVVLANYANENGLCYPSRETIAKKTGISVRSVQDHLNWLDSNGYITKESRKENTRQIPNLYRVEWNKKPSATVAHGTQKPSANPAKAECEMTQKPSATVALNTKDKNTKDYTKGGDAHEAQRTAPETDRPQKPKTETVNQPTTSPSTPTFSVNNLSPPNPLYPQPNFLSPSEPEVLRRTENALGFLVTHDAAARILEVVPEHLLTEWIELVKNRLCGMVGKHRNYILSRLGYWLGDFQRENKQRLLANGNLQQARPKFLH